MTPQDNQTRQARASLNRRLDSMKPTPLPRLRPAELDFLAHHVAQLVPSGQEDPNQDTPNQNPTRHLHTPDGWTILQCDRTQMLKDANLWAVEHQLTVWQRTDLLNWVASLPHQGEQVMLLFEYPYS